MEIVNSACCGLTLGVLALSLLGCPASSKSSDPVERLDTQRARIEARSKGQPDKTVDSVEIADRKASLRAYLRKGHVERALGSLGDDRGSVDIDAYYADGHLFYAEVIQRMGGSSPWEETNRFYLSEDAVIAAFDDEGSRLDAATADRAAEALLGRLDVRNWPTRFEPSD